MPFDTIRLGSSAAATYKIKRSLKFNYNDTPKLTWTPSSNTNAKTFTLSFWFKIGVSGRTGCIFEGNNTNANGFMIAIQTDGDGTLYFYDHGVFQIWSARVFRDPSAWYHCVVAMDTTQGTDTNRVKVYINGVQEDLSTWNVGSGANRYPDQNDDLDINQTNEMAIGESGWSGNDHWDGYIAEFHSVDGTQLTADSFGETNEDTGQWVPKKYIGSHGTNGFYLNFSDNSNTTAGTLGADSSGNGNNFTPSNFVTGDAVKDSPSHNFATLRIIKPPYESGASISDGNLKFVSGSGTSARRQGKQAISNILVNSGKWYAEFRATGATTFIGVGPYQIDIGSTSNNTRYVYIFGDGNKYVNTNGTESNATHGSSIGDGDIIGIYLDLDAGTPAVYFSKDGQWADGSGNFDESSPTSAIDLDNDFFTTSVDNDGYCGFIFSSGGSASNVNGVVNFGQDSTFSGQETAASNTDSAGKGNFKYSVPTGAKALCASNLPTPTIIKGSDYFNTVLYTGNGSTQSITGVGFQPNFTWIKLRTDTASHFLTDSVTGVQKELNSDTTNAQGANANAVTAFGTDGFSVGTEVGVNYNTESFVAWNWLESASAGFDLVTYTGDGNSNRDISHNLGVAPEFYIIKARSEAGHDWNCWHHALASGQYGALNANGAFTSDSGGFMHGAPTSSVIQLGTWNGVNKDTITFIAYLFASVEGYSKIGSYTGNGNVNGTFVYTGFRPVWLMLKRVDSGGEWNILDIKRNVGEHNPLGRELRANLNNTESGYDSSRYTDFVSNGFKLRTSDADHNASGGTYIYLAFAEQPFKYANAK